MASLPPENAMHALVLAVPFLLASAPAGFGPDPKALHERLAEQVAAAYDGDRGGFVTRAQVPVEGAVELALQRAKDPAWLQRAKTTLGWTHGLLDTLTGGYVHGGRGRDDASTLDKRADSNGRRLELLVDAWQVTDDEGYRRDADRVVDWAERVLLDGRGGFVSAQIGDRTLEPAANGAMLHGWLIYAAATHDARRRNFALQSLDRVWNECWMQPLGLVRKNEMGDLAKEPQLEDQAEMGRAYVLAARLCGRTQDEQRARAIGELVVRRFVDRNGALLTQSMPNKNGSIRKSRPVASENARAVRFLCELAELTGDARFRAAGARATAALAKDAAKSGLEAADWALAVRASYHAGLPGRGEFVAEAKEDEPPPRKRSVRFRTGH
jgi:uncharacterized protein YyaL (SSP411 family)